MNPGWTSAAADAIVKRHGFYASADLLQNGVVVKSNILLDEDNGATVQVDATAAVRRTFTCQIADALDYLPLSPSGLISPFLTEIRVYTGIVYQDGTFDRWAIFTGGLIDPKADDTDADVILSLTASDRAQSISDRLLPFPYVIAAGTSCTAAIQALILSVRPGIKFSVASPVDSTSLPATVLDQLSDPWQGAQDMAAAYGLECFFDGMGVCVIRPIPDPNNQTPVWYFIEGANAIIKEVATTLSATSSYSHAIAIGQTVDGATPVRSDVYDTDPTSPTNYTGAFGDRPIELQSDFITTQSQADAAAQALLTRSKGAVLNVSLAHVPLTALDEEDVIYIRRDRMGVNSSFVLQSFSIPCYPSADSMQPVCKGIQI